MSKMNEQDLNDILSALTPEELLAQLAEECGELSQAALKLVRARTGRNPTPRTVEECMANLTEEIADVILCISLVSDACDVDLGAAYVVQCNKADRWAGRLKGTKHGTTD